MGKHVTSHWYYWTLDSDSAQEPKALIEALKLMVDHAPWSVDPAGIGVLIFGQSKRDYEDL